MAGRSGDGIIYVALVFSALAAILSAPADSRVTYHKLRWLLTQQTSPETMPTFGATGQQITFPVSP